MSIADKLAYLNETKRQLREAINFTFGAELTEADTFRSYLEAMPFWPGRLFLNGEQGAWYDPSDLGTLFQDTESAQPVTSSGDPMGRVVDRSGNGNTAVQATSARRPLYGTDGGKSWIQTDGVDDSLILPAIYGDADNFVFAIAITPRAPKDANPRYFAMVSAELNLQCGYINNGTLFTRVAGQTYSTAGNITIGQTYVIQHIRQGGVSSIRVNGEDRIFSTGSVPSANSKITSGGSLGGGFEDTAFLASGSVYGAIYRHGVIQEEQLDAIDRYLAAKAGVTL